MLDAEANVLFLESPIGVGFSYSNTSSDYVMGDKQTGETHPLLTKIVCYRRAGCGKSGSYSLFTLIKLAALLLLIVWPRLPVQPSAQCLHYFCLLSTSAQANNSLDDFLGIRSYRCAHFSYEVARALPSLPGP